MTNRVFDAMTEISHLMPQWMTETRMHPQDIGRPAGVQQDVGAKPVGCLYPSLEFVIGRLWRFSHASGLLAAPAVRLLSDGSVGGYSHPNERSWRFHDGALEFLSHDAEVSVRWDQAERLTDGRVRLTGLHRLGGGPVPLVLEERLWGSDQQVFPHQTRLTYGHFDWPIGDHSYGHPTVYAHGLEQLVIGKYCSIGGGVTIILAQHKPDFVSTYPFALYREYWPGVPVEARDHSGKGNITIGNDVWIGHNALIMAGIKIGDGAIIGAQAVVTRDVPPYAIVGGNPARVLRYRFDQEIINRLLELRWWDLPDEGVEFLTPFILSNDIERFITQVRSYRACRDNLDLPVRTGESIRG